MIRAIINFFKAINDWGDYTQRKFVENASQLTYWPQLFLVLAVFGILWLLAWHGNVIGPWIDSVFGLGPHTSDSYGSNLVRRIWSSVLCSPIIVYALIRFAINRYRLYSEAKRSENDA